MSSLHAFAHLASWSAGYWVTWACFLLAAFLLDLFDISLPRGDSVGVTGAIGAAALLLLGPAQATIVFLGSAMAAHLVRRGVDSRRRLGVVARSRSWALAVSTVLYVWLAAGRFSPYDYVVSALIPAVFLLVEMAAAQVAVCFRSGRSLMRQLRSSFYGQAPLLVAGWSASVLILITYGRMGPWSLIPVVVLLLLMRQSFALLLDIRETYRTTVEVLVEAAESEDPRRFGHAERTAALARGISMHLGMSVSQVERISYAALLHDVDALGGRQRRTVADGVDAATGRSSAVFEGVEFFADVLPILTACDGLWSQDRPPSDDDLAAAMIVALASDADSATDTGLAQAHGGAAVDRVSPHVSAQTKARVVGAALSLGLQIPAVR